MKTADEIKEAMLHCSPVSCRSTGCPYKADTPKYEGDMPVCRMKLWHDMRHLIQQLEADKQQLEGLLAHMNQLRDAAAGRALKMEERVHQLEAERDAAVGDLKGYILKPRKVCSLCKNRNKPICNMCEGCDVFEWRGVQKEDSDA